MGEGGWGMGDGGETIHNWVFKVRSAVNHRIKNGFSIICQFFGQTSLKPDSMPTSDRYRPTDADRINC